jgi:hypothetical protein
MARYTTFRALETEAQFADERNETVWLRTINEWLLIEYVGSAVFNYTVGETDARRDEAIDLFNTEMRVYGWVSTERV